MHRAAFRYLKLVTSSNFRSSVLISALALDTAILKGGTSALTVKLREVRSNTALADPSLSDTDVHFFPVWIA